MAPEPAHSRPASPEELVRIEGARLPLVRAAWWLGGMAFGIPSLASAAVLATVLFNYPGSWLEKVGVALLDCALIFGLFAGLSLRNQTGHTLSSYRRLLQDKANGFRIARELGEVRWGKHSYVAFARGRPLFSPFFTDMSAVPGLWRNFDQLAAGSYWFELLPASGLVLNAARIGDDPVRVDTSPANTALLAAFRNGEDDRAANRDGRSTAAQRFRLVVSQAWAFVLLPAIGTATWLAGASWLRHPTLGGALGVLVAALVGVFALLSSMRTVLDVLEGRVDSAVGRASFHYGKTEATGSIHDQRFTLAHAQARAFTGASPYRVYWFRRTRRVAGAEIALAAS